MTRETPEASERQRESTDGASRFFRSVVCRTIPLSKRAVQLKWAQEIQGKRRSKKNPEGLYEFLAPGPNILKMSPTNLTIKDPGKPMVIVRNSDIAKFGTLQERQTQLEVYADRRGP